MNSDNTYCNEWSTWQTRHFMLEFADYIDQRIYDDEYEEAFREFQRQEMSKDLDFQHVGEWIFREIERTFAPYRTDNSHQQLILRAFTDGIDKKQVGHSVYDTMCEHDAEKINDRDNIDFVKCLEKLNAELADEIDRLIDDEDYTLEELENESLWYITAFGTHDENGVYKFDGFSLGEVDFGTHLGCEVDVTNKKFNFDATGLEELHSIHFEFSVEEYEARRRDQSVR